MPRAFVIAILGAESTGKSTLALQLAQALRGEGRTVAVVSEYLREFCDAQARTPLPHEQALIAAEQTRRIAAAAAEHEVVVADTSALLTAVYSDFVFGDRSLYASAGTDHRHGDLTLLTALDLPWQADGLQRDGPQVRAPVDALVRAALQRERLGFSVVAGSGAARLAAALRAVQHALSMRESAVEKTFGPALEATAHPARWQAVCERCGDARCEWRLFTGRVAEA